MATPYLGPVPLGPAPAARAPGPVTVRLRELPDLLAVLALGAGLLYAALSQGGFQTRQAELMLLAVGAAGVARLCVRGRPVARSVAVCAVCWALFAAWAVYRTVPVDQVGAALPAAALAAGLAVAVWAAAGLPAVVRRLLQAVVLGTGVVLAVDGWAGVALHLRPAALPSSGLWRASSTITYANATAAFCVLALFVALAVLPRRGLLAHGVAAVLLLGVLATMSRAGLLALAAGGAVYAAALRDRTALTDRWPVLPAAALGFAGLLPSLPEHATPRPLVALAGLAAGLLVLVAARHRAAALGGLALLAVLAAVALPAAGAVRGAVDGIADTRLTAVSYERADLTRVTAAQFARAPLVGVAPGNLNLRYVDHRGLPVRAKYVHDEYLQTAAETGIVGIALVLAGAVALAAGAVRRLRPARAPAAAALGALTAFAVHSAFDFLWHIPVLPLALVLSVVPLLATPEDVS